MRRTKTRSPVLPDLLRPLFWEYDFDALTWEADRDLIVARVLASGSWDAVRWLRSQVDDRESHCNLADAVNTHEVCFAADRSAAQGGAPIRLPLGA